MGLQFQCQLGCGICTCRMSTQYFIIIVCILCIITFSYEDFWLKCDLILPSWKKKSSWCKSAQDPKAVRCALDWRLKHTMRVSTCSNTKGHLEKVFQGYVPPPVSWHLNFRLIFFYKWCWKCRFKGSNYLLTNVRASSDNFRGGYCVLSLQSTVTKPTIQ